MLPFIFCGAVFTWIAVDYIKDKKEAAARQREGEDLLQEARRIEEARRTEEASRRRREEDTRQREEEERNRRILTSGIQEVDKMTGQEFEELLSLCFRKLGHRVQLTPASQDFGADLVVYKNDEKLIIQAKRSKNPVGISAVQEVSSAVKHYKGNKGMVITNN